MTRWIAARTLAAHALVPRFVPTAAALSLRAALPCACAALLLAGLAGVARADAVRAFPVTALRGRLEVVTPPAVQLDGRPDQLAMGARIRDTRNLFVTSGTLATGETHLVNYTRNPGGQIGEVWLLTPEEAALRLPTASPSWFERWFGF